MRNEENRCGLKSEFSCEIDIISFINVSISMVAAKKHIDKV